MFNGTSPIQASGTQRLLQLRPICLSSCHGIEMKRKPGGGERGGATTQSVSRARFISPPNPICITERTEPPVYARRFFLGYCTRLAPQTEQLPKWSICGDAVGIEAGLHSSSGSKMIPWLSTTLSSCVIGT